MNHLLNKSIIFTVGAAIVSAVTWAIVKNKYKKLAQEDIEAVREFYKEKYKNSDEKETVKNKDTDENEEFDDSDIPEEYYESYKSVLKSNKYSPDVEEDDENMNKFEVLSPEEYEECEYPTISLTYYNDGILANDRGKIISNVDEVVGKGSLGRFGEYEEDSVFVADHSLRVVYEILRDYDDFLERD